MTLAIIQHSVSDFDVWLQEYKVAEGIRTAGGVTEASFYRMADQPNTLLVLHSFGSTEEAQRFLQNPELKAAMTRGGVIGEPRIEIYT